MMISISHVAYLHVIKVCIGPIALLFHSDKRSLLVFIKAVQKSYQDGYVSIKGIPLNFNFSSHDDFYKSCNTPSCE